MRTLAQPELQTTTPSRAAQWRVWYDDQCEVCQAGLAWLRRLDRRGGRVLAVPLSGSLEETLELPSGASLDDLLRNIHVEAPGGRVLVGAQAVAALARLFPATWIAGAVASLPGFARLSAWLYRWVASNRYSLSRCRGGACRSVRVDALRGKLSRSAFRTCRIVGVAAISPLAATHFVRRLARQFRNWWRTRGRTVELFEGRLSLSFLGGGPSFTVPLLFGELFTLIRYGSLVVDPGGTRMKRAAARQIRGMQGKVSCVVPTHAHEEHCGNLELAAGILGAPIRAHPRAIPLLVAPPRIGPMRSLVIGQPRPVDSVIEPLAETLDPGDGQILQVIETPGHCAEHISLYAPRDRLLIAGDAFMGTHFSSPNDDVDHQSWIASLERLLELEIEVLVEAHGHVHTLRADVLQELERAGLAGLVSRRDPRELLREKLDFLRWVGQQIELGEREGLPPRGIRATVFPWTQRWSYESAAQDALASWVSGRAFGRHKVVRSFRSPHGQREDLPLVYELRWYGTERATMADAHGKSGPSSSNQPATMASPSYDESSSPRRMASAGQITRFAMRACSAVSHRSASSPCSGKSHSPGPSARR